MVRPQTDKYPEELERVIQVPLTTGRREVAGVLAPIALPRRDVEPRSAPPEAVIAKIYERDQFHCRSCGCKVIPTQMMRLASEVFPDEFPYHPNWKGGQTHPAIMSRSATLDHVEPWTSGGTNAPEHLVCACWICNRVKGDLPLEQLEWELQPVDKKSGWDGLTRFYGDLWTLAGKPTSGNHTLWIRLFDPSTH